MGEPIPEHRERGSAEAERLLRDPFAVGGPIEALRRERARTRSIIVLTALAGVAALYWGSVFLVPIALAITLSTLLRPVVRGLQRIHVPATLGAAIVVLGLIAVTLAPGFALTGAVRSWLARIPHDFAAAEAKLTRLRKPLERLTHAASEVTSAVEGPSPALASPAQEGSSLGSDLQSVLMHVVGTTTRIVAQGAEVLLLLYMLLASGSLFLEKLLRVLEHPPDQRFVEDSVRDAQATVRRYLAIAALIYLGQGTVVALVMWRLGLPSPLLWGVFTFVLEFIPYVGAAAMIVMLSVTALASFDSVSHILVVPLAYLVISTLQTSVVSPVTYGRHLKLNPVAVLVGVLFWWCVWGVPGAFLAVPILATVKTIADRTKPLRVLGEFLGD